jgi:hypothetical protein
VALRLTKPAEPGTGC